MNEREQRVSADDTARPRGLSAAEVAARVARGEVNRAPSSHAAEYGGIVARNVFTLFNALVVPAAVALFLLDDYRGAWAVSAVALANALLGLVQEVRAKRHLDRLALLGEAHARVVRDDTEQTIPAGDVVLGDVVLLVAGDGVVADGVVLAERYLEIDEALLTGESDPVPRKVGERLLSGSFCVAGEGAYRVEQVGAAAFAQQTAAAARAYRYVPSPMQRILDALIRALTGIAVALCVGYVGLYLLRGFPRTDLWQMIAATITSMVPQGLILMATLTFTLAAVRLSRRGAVVQRLGAVESMASVDVLCLDKTGTLTTGRLHVERITPIDTDEATARDLLHLFAWTTLDEANKSVQALRTALGGPPRDGSPELLDSLPFKSQNRYSAVRIRCAGMERVLTLGAVEALRPFIETEGAERLEAAWRALLPTGLRLLAFAEAQPRAEPPPLRDGLDGFRLRPLALIALRDELRPHAGAILDELAAQGIRFKIISGDHPATVRATLAQLGLPLAREPLLTGAELAQAADPAEAIRTHGVFGRVAPGDKLAIIAALQGEGAHVGMVGDGVNDVLAIKRADLGIAMGEGSGAARTVASLVLENNDFALLPAALDEGRVILRNLRRAAKLFLLKNVFTLFLVVAALGVLGLDFPYLPQQVTLLNALTIGGPTLLIVLSRGGGRTARTRTGFLAEAGGFAAGGGLAVGAAALAVWLLAAWGAGADRETQRTLLLTTLVLAGLGNVLIVGAGERSLLGWVALALPTYLTLLYVPWSAYFFALTPLAPAQWLAPVLAATVALGACVLVDRLTVRFSAGNDPKSACQAPERG